MQFVCEKHPGGYKELKEGRVDQTKGLQTGNSISSGVVALYSIRELYFELLHFFPSKLIRTEKIKYCEI